MGSHWPRFDKHQMSIKCTLSIGSIFGYCYHSVNGVSYGLA